MCLRYTEFSPINGKQKSHLHCIYCIYYIRGRNLLFQAHRLKHMGELEKTGEDTNIYSQSLMFSQNISSDICANQLGESD